MAQGRFSASVSLRRWKRKLRYRRRRLKRAQRVGAKSRITHWTKLVREAERMVRKRREQATPLRVRAHREAVKLLGVMERGGNNRGPKVHEIIKANGGTGPEPWCGDFVAYCYRRAGSKSVDRRWASVRLLGLLAGVRRTADPKKGDLVRYSFDHVGLFEAWCNAGGRIVPKAQATHLLAIEGNTGASGAVSDSKTGGDGVYRKVRAKSLVQDYRRVSR